MSVDTVSIFQETNIKTFTISYIYISEDKMIERIKKQKLTLQTENFLSKEELLGAIQKNRIINQVKYGLLSIVLYNLDIDQDKINEYMKNYEDITYDMQFLTSFSHINDIEIKKTLNMFDDLNTLYIIYYKKPPLDKSLQNTTKKIYISHTNKKTNKTRRIL